MPFRDQEEPPQSVCRCCSIPGAIIGISSGVVNLRVAHGSHRYWQLRSGKSLPGTRH
jgi:hypothetical protein